MNVVRNALFPLVVAAVLTSCGTVKGSVITVSRGYGDLHPTVYAIIPFEQQREQGSGAVVLVDDRDLANVETMFRARIIDVLPAVVNRQKTRATLEEIGIQHLSGLTSEEKRRVAELLNVDAIVTGTITDYFNPYNLQLAVTAIHVRTGAVLWSSQVTVRRGMNDFVNAGAKAVDVIVAEIDEGIHGSLHARNAVPPLTCPRVLPTVPGRYRRFPRGTSQAPRGSSRL